MKEFSLNGMLDSTTTKAIQRKLSCSLTKEVNRPNRKPAKGKRRGIEAHVEGNQIVAVGSELNDRLGSGARLRKAVADERSGDAAFQGKAPDDVAKPNERTTNQAREKDERI